MDGAQHQDWVAVPVQVESRSVGNVPRHAEDAEAARAPQDIGPPVEPGPPSTMAEADFRLASRHFPGGAHSSRRPTHHAAGRQSCRQCWMCAPDPNPGSAEAIDERTELTDRGRWPPAFGSVARVVNGLARAVIVLATPRRHHSVTASRRLKRPTSPQADGQQPETVRRRMSCQQTIRHMVS